DEALRLLDRAARLDFPATRASQLQRARYLELQGKADEAREAGRRARAIQPAEALDYFLSGASRQKQGKLTEAATDFADALRLQPDHFWARYFLGLCNLQQHRPAQARDNFTAC